MNTSEALLSNTLCGVSLAAGAGVETDDIFGIVGPGSGAASALADPSFQIDPTTPDARQFSIDFSPGIGNAAGGSPPPPPPPGVPEPGTLAILGTALAGVGLLRRRASRAGREPGEALIRR